MHPLQIQFATAEGESAWSDDLRTRIEDADLNGADAIISEAVAALDGDLAELCRALTRDKITINGWTDLIDIIQSLEGDPITGMTVAIGNETDLAFEKGDLHAPFMVAGLYTDDAWGWSRATRDSLMEQCRSPEPAWSGAEEDVEVFLDIAGLEALNTALIHHKQRYFIRDSAPDHAPMRYVEYVVGCWLRTLRFHQALADIAARQPLPGPVAIVSGIIEMRPEVVCVHLPSGHHQTAAPAHPDAGHLITPAASHPATPAPVPAHTPPAPSPVPAYADGDDVMTYAARHDVYEDEAEEEEQEAEEAYQPTVINLINRHQVAEVETQTSGHDLRRRLIRDDPAPVAAEPKRGWLARLFGRR